MPSPGPLPRSPPLDLVYVHDAPMPSEAANVVQVVKMCNALSAAGARVTLVAPQNSGRPRASFDSLRETYGLTGAARFGVKTLPVMRLPARMLILGAAAALRVRRGQAAAVYTRSISAAAAAAAMGRRVILEMHLPIAAYPARAARLRRLADDPNLVLLVVITESLRKDFERELPSLRGRIVVAHDGADRAASEVRTMALAGAFNVGYVGHLYPGKGMEIVGAMAPLCPWATFHVVGGAPSDLRHWRERLGQWSNVVFHGHVRHSATPPFIKAMDVLLAPYQRVVQSVGGQNLADWMSPLKIFEYMSHGKAILASNLPVIREVLENGRTALLRDPDDVASWCTALDELRADARLRETLGKNAAELFLASYTWEQRAKSILSAAAHGAAFAPGAANVSASS